MLLSDDDLPGQYDKLMWVVAFVLLFFVTPIAFILWKMAMRKARLRERQRL